MAMTTKKEKKQSKGVAGSGLTSKELKELKFNERIEKLLRSGLPASREYEYDDLSMPPDRRSKEQKIKDFKDSLLAKGGEVEVAMDNSPNSGMITTKGFGASRKT